MTPPGAYSRPVTSGLSEELLSRRRLVARGAALGGAVALAGPLAACGGSPSGARKRRVAVVGAGLAGLSCAYRLHQGGITAAVYEAHPTRVGGRCWTAREFAEGQIGEHGGEFIDSDHAHIRRLVGELGLKLDDLSKRSDGHSLLYLDGRIRPRSAAYRGYGATLRQLQAVARRTGYARSYSSPRAHAFDRRSAGQWIAQNVPAGRSRLRELMREYFSEEFGLDAGRLTATDLLYLAEGPANGEEPASSDPSDERFHVRGGNDLIVDGLAKRLPEGSLHLGAPLTALWRRDGGSYGLRFDGVTDDVVADRVVLAIPYTTLREVDLSRSGFRKRKLRCIRELGMGTNAKVILQFRTRPERFGNWNGELVTDRPFLDTWQSSLGQSGRAGLITVYSGGRVGAGYPGHPPHAPAPPDVVRETLAALERAVPGIARDFNGRAWLDNWSADPWTHGSYAAFLPGQYTEFYGVIKSPEGGVHFAGEQTSDAYQGFLEGAVASGERCAHEILQG
jgi:monoamine oxidase